MPQAAASKNHSRKMSRPFFGWALSLIVSAGLFGATGFADVHAQATGGSIFGSAPAGLTVQIQSSGGMNRHTKVNDSGHYRIGSLPLGIYSASLMEGSKEVDSNSNIRLTVGASARVDFSCPEDSCVAPVENKSP